MSETVLRIKDWSSIFENNRSRELQRLEWVPIPNKMDGAGYAELVDHPDGAAHFGAWLAIVEIASRNDVRGTLMRDGRAQTPQVLARISRLPATLFAEVIERLLTIGWLETAGKSHGSAGKPRASAEKPREGAPRDARAEGNGMERNGSIYCGAPEKQSPLDATLERVASRIFERHPVLRKNVTAENLRKRLVNIVKPIPGVPAKISKLEAIDAHHEADCESEKWSREGGEYANGLRNWLVQGLYEIPLDSGNGDSSGESPGLIGFDMFYEEKKV